MENQPTSEEYGLALGAGPFLFSGKPPFITGTVSLVNSSGEKVKVRSLLLDGPGLKFQRTRRVAPGKIAEPGPAPVRVFKRLDPLDETNARAQVIIDRYTPPGEYEAQVRFGEERATARIFVLENHQLRLTPNRLTITAAPGERVTKTVYVTNEGNVPFNTRKAAFAPLQALDMVHQSLAIALNEAGDKGHEKFLDRFFSELADREVAPAKLKLTVQDEVIGPGETKRVEITIQLPADMKNKRTYRSRIAFRDTKLAMEVDVNEDDRPGAAGSGRWTARRGWP
jgi:hypothetical protein